MEYNLKSSRFYILVDSRNDIPISHATLPPSQSPEVASISLCIASRFKGLRATSISRYRVVVIRPPSFPILCSFLALSRVHRYQFIFLFSRCFSSDTIAIFVLISLRGINEKAMDRDTRTPRIDDCRWRFPKEEEEDNALLDIAFSIGKWSSRRLDFCGHSLSTDAGKSMSLAEIKGNSTRLTI